MLKVGDVITESYENDPYKRLCCGSGTYPAAIVLSVEPFVLVSHECDMRWNNAEAKYFKKIGEVSFRKIITCKWKRGER